MGLSYNLTGSILTEGSVHMSISKCQTKYFLLVSNFRNQELFVTWKRIDPSNTAALETE
jgi:hypothetical protein